MADHAAAPGSEFERAYRYAQTAIATLSTHSIPPTPRFFELLFQYLSGTNPGLAKRIETEFRKTDLRPSDMEQICGDYLPTQEVDDKTLEFASRLSGSIDSVGVAMGLSSRSVAGFAEVLESSSDRFGVGMDERSLREVSEYLLAETGRAQLAHRELEASLEASSKEIDALRADLERVRGGSVLDGLTGIYNRKYFDRALFKAIADSVASNAPLVLVMVDIDHFKKVNDTWGHQTGDQVLRLVAATMKTRLREGDIAARYGGEEFVALLPSTDLTGGIAAANKVREYLAGKSLVKRSTGEKLGQITASFGVAMFTPGETPANLIERADRCLYAAKNAGRNRAVSEVEL